MVTVNDHRDGDGRATADPNEPAVVFGADCVPVLLAAEGAVAALHCGYRPLAGGIIANGIEALRTLGATGPITALIGPGARGCCYEVGPEVHALFTTGRHGNHLDLAEVAIEQLGERRRSPRHRPVHDLRRPLLLLPARRRDRPPVRGHMPRLITGLDARKIANNLERIREQIGEEIQILAAVKYVPLEEMATLQEAGLTLLGENRAQELEDKATAFPGFSWHFIGQLQSRKVKQIVPFATLIHSVASESALKQLGTHARPETKILIEVNVAGEEGKAGIAPDELPRYLEESPVEVARADDDAAVHRPPRGQPASLRCPQSARRRARSQGALHGYEPGFRHRCSRRCNDCADRYNALYVELCRELNPCPEPNPSREQLLPQSPRVLRPRRRPRLLRRRRA